MKPAYYYLGCMQIMWLKFRHRKALRKLQRELRSELDAHNSAAGKANEDHVRLIATLLTKRA